MDQWAFFDELKAGTVRNVYLFYGPEAYIRKSALAALEIHLVDHVIVAGPRAVSLVQAGFIHRGGTRVEKRPQLQVHRSDAKAADLSPDRLH